MKKILVVLSLVFIAACGFEPLYVQKKAPTGWYFGGEFDTSISTEMSKVRVEPISERFGQQVRNHLLDSLTPKGLPQSPDYRLYVDVKDRNIEKQALREDITATRERIKYFVTYKMVDRNYNDVLVGDSVAYVSYDILANPYSTTMAQKKAESDASKIIADDISLRVGAYFHSVMSPNKGD